MMFTCRAKRLDNGEWVEGYYNIDYKLHGISFGENGTSWTEIDPSTLQLSFNGTDWFDVATIKEALEVKSGTCETCYAWVEELGGEMMCNRSDTPMAKNYCPKDFSCSFHKTQHEYNIEHGFEPNTLSDKEK